MVLGKRYGKYWECADCSKYLILTLQFKDKYLIFANLWLYGALRVRKHIMQSLARKSESQPLSVFYAVLLIVLTVSGNTSMSTFSSA